MPIRALIVDDEPLARRRLRAFLRDEPDIAIAAECRNGEEAVASIRELHPDLVFLDVEMPALDGFAVLPEFDKKNLPLIVIVTAHDRYAVRAFDARAIDYLLKPFSRTRFRETLSRVRDHLPPPREAPAPLPPQRLAIKTGSKTVVLDPARIEWIEAEGDYVRIHAGRDIHLARCTLNRLESDLPADRFVRIHRSTILNLHHLKEIHPLPGGDHSLTLQNGIRLTLSRSYRSRLTHLLGN